MDLQLLEEEKAVTRTGLSAEIAVPIPVAGLFSYAIPSGLEEVAKIGVRVRIAFKNRELIGYLVDKKEMHHPKPLKPILEILDSEPVIRAPMLQLTKWISTEYGSSWGESIENALPRWVKFGRRADKALSGEIKDVLPVPEAKPDLNLTADQKKAFGIILNAMNEKNPRPVLLYGVTGSGKSEIYIRAIREVLKRKRSAICLVPEIALTEQIRRFFLSHFGNQLEILHSRLADNERFLAWKRLERGERNVVLGPRSAVFAPLPDLGLILMDEEHESSYKQETVPRYHAREAAAWRARNENAVFVMGTATPSLESMERAIRGEMIRVDLSTRVDEKAMPDVQLIDLKQMPQGQRRPPILSIKLAAEIEKNIAAGDGTMLLLNRRGFSTFVHCPRCGNAENCERCQVSLTYHQEEEMLLCHYCNSQKEVPDACPVCKTPMLRFGGFGTEKVESEVAARFPQARIARMDTDSVRKKGSHETVLKAFRERQIDILIGTQMIAKGFDFPHVTLVGVILADVGLMLPDFRSSERTFQLLTQVAGRAGRGEKPGRVIVQTYSPEHPSIRFAKQHDYMSFYQHETPERCQYHYPPYRRLINFIVRSRQEKKAYLFTRSLRDLLRQELPNIFTEQEYPKIDIIGPAPLPFYRLRGHFRWHVMLKIPGEAWKPRGIWEALSKLRKPAGVAMAVDTDPLNIL